MAEYLIQDTTLDAIADAINAKTGGSSAMTPAEMVTEIAAIPSGATITDGIVVKARDANGYATEIDFYGSEIRDYGLGNMANAAPFCRLQKINYMTPCSHIGSYGLGNTYNNTKGLSVSLPDGLTTLNQNAFRGAKFAEARLPISVTGRMSDNVFAQCTALQRCEAPGITSLATSGGNSNGQFLYCTALQYCEIGSVGYGITDSRTWCFRNCTQTGLTIVLYTTGAYTDTLVSNIRSSATNATIIIKASEATTYNGTTYAAGDTILTSEVTA